jgi:hypothetical protein
MCALALIFTAAWSAPGFGGVNVADMPIGFVTHYPFIEHLDDQVAATGATVMEIRATWGDLEPSQGRWSFAKIDRQLAWARQSKLKLVYILECGPAHAPMWVRRLVRIAGQETRNVDGVQLSDPSIFSPVYRKLTSAFIARCVGYLKARDADGTIVGYNNNCEWWYPIGGAYSPLDVSTFRGWLRGRYGSLGRLGAAWDAKWASWDEVDAPRVAWQLIGGPDDLGVFCRPAQQGLDTAWATTAEGHVAVEPGKEYQMRAVVDLDKVTGAGAYLEVAFLGPTDPMPIGSMTCPGVRGTREGVELLATGKVPLGATRAWLLMKFCGTGKAVYRKVFFGEVGSDRNLAPNPGLGPAKGRWSFAPFTVAEPLDLEKSWAAPGEVVTEYSPASRLGVGNGTAAIYDWTTFLQDSTADFIDWIAAEIKKVDATRPVVTYLTYAFAQPFNWDYVFNNNIALDRIWERAKHQDVLGMQLAAADGDYHNVTCALDLSRKYGKPMWAIDLLDYTSGVGIGERSLLRTSLAVVQHGGTGISYYCWYGTADYNYSELPAADLRDLVETTKQVAAGVRGLRPVAEVALVEPIMPYWTGLPEPPNDFRDFMGWYKLLVSSGLCPDVYTIQELERADLGRYRLVVVPDCAYVSDEALKALMAAAKGGVPVIAPRQRFARRDMGGRERPVVHWPSGARVVASEDWGRSFLGPIKRVHKAGNTPPMFILEPGAPHYDGPELGRLREALAKLRVTPTVRVQPEDPRVEACALEGGGKSSVLLLTDGSRPPADLTAEVGGKKVAVGAVDLWALRSP